MAEQLASWTDGAARAAIDFFDDGPEKPVRIWSRIGRRPLLAFGNSNGDLPILAAADGWTVVSIRRDWRVVFAGAGS